jgi:hypothetical protein
MVDHTRKTKVLRSVKLANVSPCGASAPPQITKATPLPLEAQEHVKSCKRCQELVEALNMPVAVESLAPATLQEIAEGIAINLGPVSPVAPAGYFFGGIAGIFVSIVALCVYRMGALAIVVMTPLETVAILTALAVSTGLLAYSLVHQMIPGSPHRISPRLLPVGIAVLLTIVIGVLFQFQHEQNFWGHAHLPLRSTRSGQGRYKTGRARS